MLPPQIELRAQRVLTITESGHALFAALSSRDSRSESEITEQALLELIAIEGKPLATSRLARLPGGESAAARLQRGGYLAAQEISKARKPRTQKIIAWSDNAAIAQANGHAPSEAEARIRQVLTEECGPLPLASLLDRAKVSRAVAERLVRQGKLKQWEEPAIVGRNFLEAEFEPITNILNPDQERAAQSVEKWIHRGEFHSRSPSRRHRQRQN